MQNAPQRSEAWHQERKGRLTGSLFGAALGLNPYMSRQQLWRVLTGREAAFEGNEATDWGTEHEPIAIDAYECETGNIVMPAPFVPHEEWSGASPDGYIGEDGLIEVKCPFSQNLYAEWPVYYRAQVIGQLGITKRAWCDCWCWTPNGQQVVERIYNVPEIWHNMEDALKEFWQHVIDDREPKRQKKFKFNELKEAA